MIDEFEAIWHEALRKVSFFLFFFLDASTPLYMRVCLSVRPSFCRSVTRFSFWNAEIDFSDKSDKSDKSLSTILSTFRRIFVRTNLLYSNSIHSLWPFWQPQWDLAQEATGDPDSRVMSYVRVSGLVYSFPSLSLYFSGINSNERRIAKRKLSKCRK